MGLLTGAESTHNAPAYLQSPAGRHRVEPDERQQTVLLLISEAFVVDTGCRACGVDPKVLENGMALTGLFSKFLMICDLFFWTMVTHLLK